MTMKKFAAMLCAASMTLSLAACGGTTDSAASDGASADGASSGGSDLVIGMTVNNAGADPYQTARTTRRPSPMQRSWA